MSLSQVSSAWRNAGLSASELAHFPVAETLAQMLTESPCCEAGVEIILGERSELDWIPMHISAFEM